MTASVAVPVEHELRCWPNFFEPILTLQKRFEIRKNDRGFKVGDVLRLREWDQMSLQYSGREIGKRVSYITDFDQQPGYVVMSLSDAPIDLAARPSVEPHTEPTEDTRG